MPLGYLGTIAVVSGLFWLIDPSKYATQAQVDQLVARMDRHDHEKPHHTKASIANIADDRINYMLDAAQNRGDA